MIYTQLSDPTKPKYMLSGTLLYATLKAKLSDYPRPQMPKILFMANFV